MQQHPLPPVPQKLREMLSGYPDLIESLQEVLVTSVERSRRVPLSPFDDAISAIAGRLDSFFMEARSQRRKAEATGDDQLIAAASQKERLLSSAAQKWQWDTDPALFKFFGSDFK